MTRVADLLMCEIIKTGVKVGKCYVHHTDSCESWLDDCALRPDVTPLVEPDAGCKYGHMPEKCKFRYEAIEFGQDKTAVHSFDVPSLQWALDGRGRLTKKGRVMSRMVFVFKETRERGFWLRVSKTQFYNYNVNRMSRSLKTLDEPLGIRQISPGKNKDGLLTYETMSKQLADVMYMMGILHPDLQLVFLFDWRSGHAKNQDGELAVLQMNSKYGGKKGKDMTDTEMVERFLGEGEAKLWKLLGGNNGVLRWFASIAAAAEYRSGTVVEVDCKLKHSDT